MATITIIEISSLLSNGNAADTEADCALEHRH